MTELEMIKSPQDYLPAEQIREINMSLSEARIKAVSLRVVNDEAMEEANALCGTIKTKQKSIESFRLAIVKPLKDHIATIDKFFKNLGSNFDEPYDVAEKKVIMYREKKIAAERAEREKLAREAQEKEDALKEKKRKEAEALAAQGRAAEAEKKLKEASEVKVEVKEPKKEVPAKSSYQEGVGRTTFVKDADYRIDEPALVPKEFWIIDEKRIRDRVREVRGTLEVGKVYRDIIPGVAITSTERMTNAGEK